MATTDGRLPAPPRHRRMRKAVAAALIAAAVVALGAGLWWWMADGRGRPAVVDDRPVAPSGLPLPRFVSLGAPRANLRSGPGREYPVRWVYVRRHWPLKVVQEYGVWRKVEDIDGTTGWMHAALLSGRRTGIIRGPGPVPLTARPRPDAPVLYEAEPGVLVRILACDRQWCRVRIAGGKAWVRKERLWGVLPQEIID